MTVPNFRCELHNIQDIKQLQVVETKVNLGLITQIDARDIPTGAVQVATNTICRYDKLGRRSGTVLLTQTKPNSQPITKLAFIETAEGNPNSVRMTPSSLHVLNFSGWTPITISPSLTGGVADRFNVADVLDNFIFTNNGADPPQVIDFGAGTCTALGNWAGVYPANPRFVIGFFNRAVLFALKDSGEVTAAWSADGIPTQFDPSVDNTAGSSPIIESPADFSDFMTGALAFTNVAIIFRQHSIWLASKQPIPTDPFYFWSAVPGIGCDCSYSIQLVNNAVAWVDSRRRKVYVYVPGSMPEEIEGSIRDQLFNDITDSTQVFSSYNALQSEYEILVPVGANITRAYVYNFEGKTWVIREYYGLTCADNFELATQSGTIDQLPGSIDSLVGTIDSLSKSGQIIPIYAMGRNDGSIIIENPTTELDAPHADFPSGIVFTTLIQSKLFSFPDIKIIVNKINISYQCSRPTTILLEYSKDNGMTWITGKTITPTIFNRPINIRLNKTIRCSYITWRISCSSSDVQLLGYEVYPYPSGDIATGE